jgi:putative membrane protein
VERYVLRLFLSALAVLVAGTIFPDWISVRTNQSALVFVLVLGLLNATVRPILLIFTFPLTILTLGLFTIAINAIVFRIATQISTGVRVEGFIGAMIGSINVSVVSFLSSRLAH